jgi:phosphatidylserine decarboxylase
VDYHYFHFVDDGQILATYEVLGEFHSVSPIAILKNSSIIATNERFVTLIGTSNFGKIAYVEVGALGVGKIVQLHNEKNVFSKGDIKGHFLFGASTVVVVGEVGRWRVCDDIIDRSASGIETFVRLGDSVGKKSVFADAKS